MRRLSLLVGRIDRFSEAIGRAVNWLVLFMVLVGAFNAVARYLDRYLGLGLSGNTYIELQWYMFAAIFLLGSAYTLKHNAHVRVDVLYGRLGARGKAWVDLVGTAVFLLPFCVLMIWTSWPFVADSWMRFETSPDPGGLPRYPIKTIVPLAFVLLIIQGTSLLIRQILVLKGAHAPATDRAEPGEGV